MEPFGMVNWLTGREMYVINIIIMTCWLLDSWADPGCRPVLLNRLRIHNFTPCDIYGRDCIFSSRFVDFVHVGRAFYVEPPFCIILKFHTYLGCNISKMATYVG